MSIVHLSAIVCAGVGVALSVIQIIALFIREYDKETHHTLSHVGAKDARVLAHFRRILIVCGTLITIGVLFGIAPYTSQQLGLSVLWVAVLLCEVGAALIPAKKGIAEVLHTILGLLMGIGFLAFAILMVRILPIGAVTVEYYLCLLMGLMIVLAAALPKKLVYFELAYIFFSHVSIVVALFALR